MYLQLTNTATGETRKSNADNSNHIKIVVSLLWSESEDSRSVNRIAYDLCDQGYTKVGDWHVSIRK